MSAHASIRVKTASILAGWLWCAPMAMAVSFASRCRPKHLPVCGHCIASVALMSSSVLLMNAGPIPRRWPGRRMRYHQ
eukprot:1460448-Prymnesium_polylepis.1